MDTSRRSSPSSTRYRIIRAKRNKTLLHWGPADGTVRLHALFQPEGNALLVEHVATREAFRLAILDDFLEADHAIDLRGVAVSTYLGNIIQIDIFTWGCIFYDECGVLWLLKWDHLPPGWARVPIDFPSSWLLAHRKRQLPSQDTLNAACTAQFHSSYKFVSIPFRRLDLR